MKIMNSAFMHLNPNNLQKTGSLMNFINSFTRPSTKKHFSITTQTDPLEAVHDILSEIAKSKDDISAFQYQIQNFDKTKILYYPIPIRLKKKQVCSKMFKHL